MNYQIVNVVCGKEGQEGDQPSPAPKNNIKDIVERFVVTQVSFIIIPFRFSIKNQVRDIGNKAEIEELNNTINILRNQLGEKEIALQIVISWK